MPAPPELSDLQGFLQSALRRREPIEADDEVSKAARVHVAGNDRLTPAQQADIYREQYWARHREALAEDYIGLAALLGPEAFESFLTAYLVACPPRHPSLRDLGDRITQFAESYADFTPELRELAIEMVRYENALVEVFDGADPPPLDATKLAGMDEDAWDRARIVLHPLFLRMKLDHPVHTYRIAAKALAEEHGSECATCSPSEAPPLPTRSRVWLGLFRSDLVVSYEQLEPEAFALLEAIAAGDPLPRACDRVADALDEEGATVLMSKVGAWFQQWTAWRWIVDIVVPDPADEG